MRIVSTIQSKQPHPNSLFLIGQGEGLPTTMVGPGRVGFTTTVVFVTPSLRHGTYAVVINCWDDSFSQKSGERVIPCSGVDGPQLNLM